MARKRLSRFAITLGALLLASACAHESAASGSAVQPRTAAPAPPTETKEVAYDGGGVHMKGFIAYPPAAQGKRPGVLIVHEWWGLNDYVRSRARKLAEMGYVALAIDMYGDGKLAAHPDDAKKYMSEMLQNLEGAVQRFEAAKTLLASDARVDGGRIAAIGYCFGGAVVLHMARIGSDLDAVASFHGNLVPQTPMKKDGFAGQILVATGGADPFVPPEQVEAFKQEMAAADQSYELVIYPGAKHSFTNPDATEAGKKFQMPLEYNAEADADSWQKLRLLLQRIWP